MHKMDNVMFTSGRKSGFLYKARQRDVVYEKSDRQQFLTLARRYFSKGFLIVLEKKCNLIFVTNHMKCPLYNLVCSISP